MGCGSDQPHGLPMNDLKTLGERIDALEARLMFQDETIETLNKTITEQWAKIDALTRHVTALTERLQEAETRLPRGNEPPPHY
jgi:SlyX protein